MVMQRAITDVTVVTALKRLNSHIQILASQCPSDGWRGYYVGVRKVPIIPRRAQGIVGRVALPDFCMRLSKQYEWVDATIPEKVKQHPLLQEMYMQITQPDNVQYLFMEDWLTRLYDGYDWMQEINSNRFVSKVIVLWEPFLRVFKEVHLNENNVHTG
jgi:hypothetical protein